MKFVHLSDLHLGRRLGEVSLLEDQKFILQQILRIIKDEKADAVLMSGDIYDKSVPSAEAVTLFDEFLSRLAELKVQVLVISGNHDSSERLAFGNKLFSGAGIHLSPVYNGQVRPVVLSDEEGEVCFWLLPFIKPAHVRQHFPETGVESYTDACRVAVEQMAIDPSKRNVLLTHQFVTGAVVCDSEEISVGGTDNVDASVFKDFDYVALGHIHGPQNIGSSKLRYCGTPLKYSFSEVKHIKSVTVVELGQKGQLHITTPGLTPLRDMQQVTGSFDHIITTGEKTEDYMRVILTDEDEVYEAVGKLRVLYPNLLELKYDNTRTRTQQVIEGPADVEHKSELQLFEELYQQQNKQPLSDVQRAFMQELIEGVREGQS